jgi:predicted nucleotidyltransferase
MADELDIDKLARQLGVTWPHLAEARARSDQLKAELRRQLEELDSADLSIVALGSVGRGEVTESSDLDWTLLVDGSADPEHFETARQVGKLIKEVVPKVPGREGTFGNLVFSHDLVHHIGGEDDTNKNTTRRSLMLLEGVPLGRDEAFERTVRAILSRYLHEDQIFLERKTRYHVPRFMLNDFARYWRTMAVDFAYKRRDRHGEGAAIRNLKLRFSRKLLYASALLTCFSCELRFGGMADGEKCPLTQAECVDCLRQWFRKTPLDVLSAMLLLLLEHDEQPETCAAAAKAVLSSYDDFVGMLADGDTRKHLEELTPDAVDGDKIFQRARKLSQDYRDGLLYIFFETKLANLTRFYGVF